MTDGRAAVPRGGHRALRVLASSAGATWRVVVCPHAGGAASYYRRLVLAARRPPVALPGPRGARAPFAGAPEVVAVQYPGRETRFAEPPVQTMTDLVADVAGPVRALLADDVPTVLLGHSLGASVAVRVAAGLGPTEAPDLLVVSGRSARADHTGPAGRVEDGRSAVGPGRGTARDDAALRSWVAALGGTPPELLADAELFALHARVLRADLAVHDSLAAGDGPAPAITAPLLLLAGSDDVASPPESVLPWSERARAGVRHRVVEGGHFFVGDRAPEVLDALRAALTAVVTGSSARDTRDTRDASDTLGRGARGPAAEGRWVRSREVVAADLRRLEETRAGGPS